MDFSMQKIDSLQGKANWEDWKHLMQIRLSGIPDAIEAINGKLEKPQEPSTTATVEEKNAYKKKLDKFNKTQSDVMFLLVSTSSQSIRSQIRNLLKPDEVWKELHNLFAGVEENKVYDVCSQCFSYKWNEKLDMAGNLSSIRQLWGNLQEEIVKIQEKNEGTLPEIFLICKIFEILPKDYSNFQTTWLMIHSNRKERSIDNLVTWLCTEANKLASKVKSENQEALTIKAVSYTHLR